MSEQPAASPAFHALAVVMRDYLSYGEDGIEDLKTQVQARRRKPVINAFCEELHRILSYEAPIPTDLINGEFVRRVEEEYSAKGEDPAEVDVVQYTDQQAYEALADLWEYLELTAEGGSTSKVTALRSAVKDKRSQLLWVEGDPVQALRSWVSWRPLALCVAGVALCIGSWTAHTHVGNGTLRGLLLLLTLIGFVAASIGGGTLWLRRVRYINPDAFLPVEKEPKGNRR
ncbi:hypothetical protein [Wenjunlia tyrosinilytica]|uniref:hypothetical protein n=1 Tax=Wenjunlia tyrosinilytica TaxID=1544741 RepID=UPI0016654211|nr:hypothetical protein [Wenjunlia tyrosinilytica]